MYITKELLIEKSACKEGLDWFNKNFPSEWELNDESIAKISDCKTDFLCVECWNRPLGGD